MNLAFHTLLFYILLIELFGMTFLLFRLIILPLIRTIVGRLHKKERNEKMEEDQLTSLRTTIQIKEGCPLDSSHSLKSSNQCISPFVFHIQVCVLYELVTFWRCRIANKHHCQRWR
jgi:hypothetical protein